MRVVSIGLALSAAVCLASPAQAEWQLKPFAGITFAGKTDIIDNENAVGTVNFVIGGNVGQLGEVFGWEADVGFSPGFFDKGDQTAVLKSSLTTATGNVLIAMPRRMSQYGLRPYFVGGGGLLQVSVPAGAFSGVFELSRAYAAIDLGGGATGFFSDSFGVNWDLRHFQTVGATVPPGYSINGTSGRLSFWRGTMALVYRY